MTIDCAWFVLCDSASDIVDIWTLYHPHLQAQTPKLGSLLRKLHYFLVFYPLAIPNLNFTKSDSDQPILSVAYIDNAVSEEW